MIGNRILLLLRWIFLTLSFFRQNTTTAAPFRRSFPNATYPLIPRIETQRPTPITLVRQMEQLLKAIEKEGTMTMKIENTTSMDFLSLLQHEELVWKTTARKQQQSLRVFGESIIVSLLLLTTASIVSKGSTKTWVRLYQDGRHVFLQIMSVHGPVLWLYWIWRDSLQSKPSQSMWHTAAIVWLTFAKPNVLRYMWTVVLPKMGDTLRQMVVTEVWANFWAQLSDATGSVVVSFLSHMDEQFSWISTSASLPPTLSWWDEPQSSRLKYLKKFAQSAIQRGTRNLFKSALQKHLDAALTVLAKYAIDKTRGHFTSNQNVLSQERNDSLANIDWLFHRRQEQSCKTSKNLTEVSEPHNVAFTSWYNRTFDK